MKQFRSSATRLAAICAAGVMAGCASGFPGARPLTYATPGEARLFVSPYKCPHDTSSEEATGLVAAILTGAASQLLTNFGTALQQGAQGGNLPSSVATLNFTPPPNGVPRCIVLIRGAFERDRRNANEVNLQKLLGLDLSTPEDKNRYEGFNFVPMYRVDHLIEIQMLSSRNSKALTFAPIFVRLDRSIDGAREGERDISIALKFNRAGQQGTGSAVVVSDRMIGQVPVVMEPHPKTGRFAREAPWFGTFHDAVASADAGGVKAPASSTGQPALPLTPGMTGAAAASPLAASGSSAPAGGGGAIPLPTNPSPAPIRIDLFSKTDNAVPVTMTATVVETRPANEGLAFIASVFGSSVKPKLEEAIKPIIDSEVRTAAEQTQGAAALTAEADYAAAELAAELAVLAYCSGANKDNTLAGRQDRLTKSSNARIAQLKANAAALRIGRSPRFAPLITSSEGMPGSLTGCP